MTKTSQEGILLLKSWNSFWIEILNLKNRGRKERQVRCPQIPDISEKIYREDARSFPETRFRMNRGIRTEMIRIVA